METAFVTGGLGLIGSFIARRLIEDDIVDKVVLLDHYGSYIDPTRKVFTDYRKLRVDGIEDRVIIERGEVRYLGVVSRLMRKYKPKYIYHLAALPLAKLDNLNVQEAQEGSVDSTNVLLSIIGDLSQEIGYMPKRFVYASSSMVYGDFISETADEDHPTNPKEIYGTMKLAGEVVTRGLSGFFNIPYSIIRPSAVYGPTDMNRRVSQIFLEKAIRNEIINIHGIDEALDFTYVKDIAKGFVLASIEDKGIGETFNITCGNAKTLLEYAQALKKHFPDVEYKIIERDAFRPKRGTLSIDKARKLLSYEPDYDLEKGIDEYVRFVKKHNLISLDK